jgi:hypothetical protein
LKRARALISGYKGWALIPVGTAIKN